MANLALDQPTPAPVLFSRGDMITWTLLCVEATLLSGCHRGPPGQAPRVIGAPLSTDKLMSQVDVGASLLAEVDNARLAIELHDLVAAYNDVNEALAFARQLTNRPSKLLLSGALASEPGIPSGVSHVAASAIRMTAFDALVKLGSARAELENNVQAADADLRAIQIGIPEQLIPGDLQFVRAAASLDMARNAVSEGRISELKTQLLTAQLALNAYAGPGHVVEAKALAVTIVQTLRQANALSTIPPTLMSLWLGIVVGWAGSERWDALRPDLADHHQSDLP